jgi:phosphoribosylaminoimidazole (AIR) synthetase
MMRTFNYGIGLVLISEDTIVEATLIGEVVKGDQVVTVID